MTRRSTSEIVPTSVEAWSFSLSLNGGAFLGLLRVFSSLGTETVGGYFVLMYHLGEDNH